MRKLVVQKAVLKDLPELPAKQYARSSAPSSTCWPIPAPHYSKPLHGSPYRRIAAGEYRVVYRFDDESVYVAVVGKRNDDDVYRQLERKQ